MKCGVWRVQCEVWGVKSAVWSVECEVWSVECEVWSVECEVWSVECEVWSVECEVWSVDCEVWSLQWEACSGKHAVWRVHCEVCSMECEDCQVWSVKWSFKCDMWNKTPVSQSARTHGLGWRTAHASSIDEKGLIYIFKATSAPPRAGTTGINGNIYVHQQRIWSIFCRGPLADWQCTYWVNKPTNMVKHVTCEGCHLVGFRLVSYSLNCGLLHVFGGAPSSLAKLSCFVPPRTFGFMLDTLGIHL